MTKIFYSILIFILLIFSSCGERNSTTSEKPSPITLVANDSAFFNKAVVIDTARKDEVIRKLRNFYQKNKAQTKWLLNSGPSNLFTSLLETLGNAKDFGLSSEVYNYHYLKAESKAIYEGGETDVKRIGQLDRDATASFLLFISHLNKGQILSPGYKENYWFKNEQEDAEIEKFLQLDRADSITKFVENVQPAFPFYYQLREQLRKLIYSKPRNIISFNFDSLDKFEVGWKDEKIRLLRNNLNQWGVDVEMDIHANVLDSTLIEGIKSFQEAFNLKEDGLPGESTLHFLNMQDKELKELLALNLDRLRWLPEGIGENLIMVNIPEYTLRIFNGNEVAMQMKVIVGEEMKPTPVFSDTLSHIVFNPTWTVPQSIIWDEMVPKLQENSGHFEEDFIIYEDNKEIDPYFVDWQDSELKKKHYYKFEQQPGPGNSLGEVKFMFPNSLSIYLHDTPADVLFSRTNRDLSHGCVRLERPFQLADYLLSDNRDWSKDKMNSILLEEEPHKVYLNQKYRVQIAYLTAWVDDSGRLKLFDDVYGFDKVQLEKLEILKELASNAKRKLLQGQS